MDGGVAVRSRAAQRFVGHIEIRRSHDDRCAECGDAVGSEWLSYRQYPGDPQSVVKQLGMIPQRFEI